MTTHCDGCDEEQEDVRRYLVTFYNGMREVCEYCPECADLARINWNGETAAIEPMGETLALSRPPLDKNK